MPEFFSGATLGKIFLMFCFFHIDILVSATTMVYSASV